MNAGRESPYGGTDEQFEAFWRTIIADNPIGAKPVGDPTCHFQELDAVKSWISSRRSNYDLLQTDLVISTPKAHSIRTNDANTEISP